MRILIVTANFKTDGTNPWLLDDLAREFAIRGHAVDVVVHSPTSPRPRGDSPRDTDGVRTFSVGAERKLRRRTSKLWSYIATGLRLHRFGRRFVRSSTYDLCIYSSIGAFSYGFPSWVRRKGIAKSLVFMMWDFFPVHQLEIGRIKSTPFNPLMKWIEWLAIKRADVITTMSPANERFLRSYHNKTSARIIHVPPWAATEPTNQVHDKRKEFTVVFGGQLVSGRGVTTLLDAAKELEATGGSAHIIVAGDGVARQSLKNYAKDLDVSNVEFVGMLPRASYRALLATAHVGVAVTVDNVSVPSFPSKISEYCANGLPVVACLEESSDAGRLIESARAGVSVQAGDSHALANAIAQLSVEFRNGTLYNRALAASALFQDQLSVQNAVDKILNSLVIR